MRRIRSKDTTPERVVRKLAYALGFRYRLHDRKLPGTPDLVFKSRRKAIFVHGCFWHQHQGCKLARLPRSNLDYWLPKLQRNQERDEAQLRDLKTTGWRVLVVWECATRNTAPLARRLNRFLSA